MKILIAEDDPQLGDALQSGLRLQGFQVNWVRDGFAAMRFDSPTMPWWCWIFQCRE